MELTYVTLGTRKATWMCGGRQSKRVRCGLGGLGIAPGPRVGAFGGIELGGVVALIVR